MAEAKEPGWWGALVGMLQRKDPLEATLAAMSRAEAYVNPTRLFLAGSLTAYNPSVFINRKGMSELDKIKRDEQVKACLNFKKSAILASGWEVVSPGDQDEEWEVTRFVKDQLDHWPGGFKNALKKILLKLDYGFSITEKVYGDAEWAPQKKVIVRFISIMPHFIDFEESPSGELLSVIQRTSVGSLPEEILPPAKFVIMTHEKEFENTYGRSDLEAVYRPWWLKDNAYKWFAVFLERYGMAPLLALYNPNKYQGAQLNNLKTIVSRIQNATFGILPRPEPDDLEMYSQQISAESKGIFLAALGRCDADIGKGLLVPSLIGAGGDSGKDGQGSAGSYARAETHFKSFTLMVDDEKADLAEAVNAQIVKQLCDLNFTGLKSYPIVRMLPLDNDVKLELYKTWAELVKGRIVNQIPDDETHMRKALGFPENENPEELSQPDQRELLQIKQAEAEKEVPEKEQTREMRQFAEQHDGVWIQIGDGPMVCVKRHAWDESKHPRHPKGAALGQGGEFAPKGWSPRLNGLFEIENDLLLSADQKELLALQHTVTHAKEILDGRFDHPGARHYNSLAQKILKQRKSQERAGEAMQFYPMASGRAAQAEKLGKRLADARTEWWKSKNK